MTGKPKSDEESLRRRRGRAYELRLQGFQPSEISQLLSADSSFGFGGVSERTIWRDLKICEEAGAAFFIRNRRLEDRIAHFFYDEYNHLLLLRHEAWLQYYEARDEKDRKLEAILVINQVSRTLHRLAGITGINIKDLEVREDIRRLSEKEEEIAAALKLRRTGLEDPKSLR